MNTLTETPATSQPKQAKTIDFGNGKYSPLMRECFQDLQRIFGCSEQVAETVAKDIGREYGALMSNHTTVGVGKVKIGKLNADGQFTTVKEAASSIKKVNATPCLQVLQVIAWLNDSPFGYDGQGEKVRLVIVDKVTAQHQVGAYLGIKS